MQELTGKSLHQSILGGIHIECPAKLTATMENYFKSNGFHVGNVICLSNEAPDKLNLIFEVATQARKLAEVIMGLLNRNDVEIELNLCTRGDLPQTAKLKLRSLKDREECEHLIKNLASIVVHSKQENE